MCQWRTPTLKAIQVHLIIIRNTILVQFLFQYSPESTRVQSQSRDSSRLVVVAPPRVRRLALNRIRASSSSRDEVDRRVMEQLLWVREVLSPGSARHCLYTRRPMSATPDLLRTHGVVRASMVAVNPHHAALPTLVSHLGLPDHMSYLNARRTVAQVGSIHARSM